MSGDVDPQGWVPVCAFEKLQPERGAAALIGDTQIAVFRTYDDAVYAIGNQDPVTGAFVLSRGIVGSRGQTPTIASPLHKEVYDLRTGACLDNDAVRVTVYPVRVRQGLIEVTMVDQPHLGAALDEAQLR